MTDKKTLVKSVVSKKDFSFRKGKCSLNFILRTDNTSELRDFRSCLKEAMNDIDEILKTMKN